MVDLMERGYIEHSVSSKHLVFLMCTIELWDGHADLHVTLDPSRTENLSYPILPTVSCNCNIIIRYLASYQ